MSQAPPPPPHTRYAPPSPGGSSTPPPPGYAAPAEYGTTAGHGTPAGQGAPGPRADIRPKARWFWIGGGVIAAGVIAAVTMLVPSIIAISDTVDDFERVSNDGGDVAISEPGKYVVYAEGGASAANVDITTPDGEPVRLSLFRNGLDYEFNGRSGTAIYTFQVSTPGVYRVRTDTPIAVGESIAGDLIDAVVLPFLVGGLGLLVGLATIIVTGVRRSGSKKRAANTSTLNP